MREVDAQRLLVTLLAFVWELLREEYGGRFDPPTGRGLIRLRWKARSRSSVGQKAHSSSLFHICSEATKASLTYVMKIHPWSFLRASNSSLIWSWPSLVTFSLSGSPYSLPTRLSDLDVLHFGGSDLHVQPVPLVGAIFRWLVQPVSLVDVIRWSPGSAAATLLHVSSSLRMGDKLVRINLH